MLIFFPKSTYPSKNPENQNSKVIIKLRLGFLSLFLLYSFASLSISSFSVNLVSLPTTPLMLLPSLNHCANPKVSNLEIISGIKQKIAGLDVPVGLRQDSGSERGERMDMHLGLFWRQELLVGTEQRRLSMSLRAKSWQG